MARLAASEGKHGNQCKTDLSKQTRQVFVPTSRRRHFLTDKHGFCLWPKQPNSVEHADFHWCESEKRRENTETTPVRGDKAGGPSCRMAVDAVKWRISPQSCADSYWLTGSWALAPWMVQALRSWLILRAKANISSIKKTSAAAAFAAGLSFLLKHTYW